MEPETDMDAEMDHYHITSRWNPTLGQWTDTNSYLLPWSFSVPTLLWIELVPYAGAMLAVQTPEPVQSEAASCRLWRQFGRRCGCTVHIPPAAETFSSLAPSSASPYSVALKIQWARFDPNVDHQVTFTE